MKSTIVGGALAIIFLALIFAAPRFLPHGVEGMSRAEIAQIGPGFSGTRYIGPWKLVCTAPAVAAKTGRPPAGEGAVGRCRMARGYREKNGQMILTLAFRYAGPQKNLTMIVRFPPVAQKGQFLVVSVGPRAGIRVPVFGCAPSACVAVGVLIPAATAMLVGSSQAHVDLPAAPDGKQYTIGIGLGGLGAALTGMHRAEL